MTKRKVKNSVAHPRPPKTRRRECPVEPQTTDLQANLKDIADDSSPPKKSTVFIAVEQQKAEDQSPLTGEEAEGREVTDVSANTKNDTAMEVGTPPLNSAPPDSQPEYLMAPTNNNVNQDGDNAEAKAVAETNRSEPSTDPVQVIYRPQSAFGEQPEPNESFHRAKIQEKDQHNSTSDSTSDVRRATIETQVSPLPAKKKPPTEMFDQAQEMSLAPKSFDAKQTVVGGSDVNNRIQDKVNGVLITLDRLSAVVEPAQEDQICKDHDGVVHIPQGPVSTSSDPRAEQKDQEQHQLDGEPVQKFSEEPSQQIQGGPPSLGPGKKDTLDVDGNKDTRSSFLSTNPCHMNGSTVLFAPGHLDYVTDSQLNTIPLTEEEIVKGDKDLGSPGSPDGTDLISGLIKELSWLNRKVMASHRELENIRRNNRSLKSSTR